MQMMQLKVLLKVKLGRNKSWKSCMENNGKVGLFCVVLLAIFPLHQTHQIGDWILKMCKPCREYFSLSPLSLSLSLYFSTSSALSAAFVSQFLATKLLKILTKWLSWLPIVGFPY